MTTGPAPITGKDWQNHVEPRIMAEDLRALEQGIQQALDGGGGTGIELVSGTVTLSGSGAPIREFYTTAAATIGGVSFAAGTAVVFRRAPGGQWGYKAVDGWTPITSDPDPGLITVTATAPTWTDNTVNGGGSWTTPTITGVTYSPASGTASPGQTVTVTATAQAGYQLSGVISWSHSFPAAPGPFPETGFTDFSTYDLGPLPSSWTDLWTVVPAEIVDDDGIAILRTTNGGSALRGCLTLANMPDTLNAEALVKVRSSAASGTRHLIRARAQGPAGSETAYTALNTGATTKTFRVSKYVAGAFTEPAGATHDMLPNLWYWARLRVSGDQLQAKIWEDGTSEPTDWMHTSTDTSITTPGKVGIATGSAGMTVDFAYFSYGLDGQAAP